MRKHEMLSAIPWINRLLLKVELAPRLRATLYQANVKWTAGGLILMCIACFVFPAYLVYSANQSRSFCSADRVAARRYALCLRAP